MEELIASLKVVLGNTYVTAAKSQSYHWNVEGKNFKELHSFFGDIYDTLFTMVDDVAEKIRILDVYAPISITEILSYKTIAEDLVRPLTISQMFSNLLSANKSIIDALKHSFSTATNLNEQGIADYVSGQIDVIAKQNWMIKSFLKGVE